jgi:NAD(P)-dependent dehydrogenase (short-subunit alcohol dehydrogenase family)
MSHNVALVVAERGANWSSWMERFRTLPAMDESVRVLAVVQREHEDAHALGARVRRKLRDLHTQGCAVKSAVLVGGQVWSPDVLAGRASCVRTLASHMAEQGHGKLLLDAGLATDATDAVYSESSHAMTALAHMVSDEVKHTDVRVVAVVLEDAVSGMRGSRSQAVRYPVRRVA